MDEKQFWPFQIVKPKTEWSRFDRDYVQFLRTAFAEGFRPSVRSDNFVMAESPGGRTIALIFRGSRNGWEVCPSERQVNVPLGPIYRLPDWACVCVRPPFSAAGHFALEWLRGSALTTLLSDYEFIGGSPPGVVLRPFEAKASGTETTTQISN